MGVHVSRLESFIRRLEAQRRCLNYAARAVRKIPGPVLELGLGNGRTFDHLRGLLPEREIFVFERQIAAHPDSRPDAAHLILGDLRETLPSAIASIGAPAALVHLDIGSGDREANRELAAWLGPALPPLLARDALVVADQPLRLDALQLLPLPRGVAEGRYFLYRAG